MVDINLEIRKSCSRALKAFARVRNIGYNANPYTSYQVVATDGSDGTGKGTESANDSFRACEHFPFTEYQWQLGSLYFPQQPVSGTGPTGVLKARSCSVSAYAHLLEAVDKYQDNAPIFNAFSGVPSGARNNGDDYYTKWSQLGYDGGEISGGFGFNGSQTTLAVTLERSTMFNLAGVPVNNSRVLALRAKLDDTNNEVRADRPAVVSTNNKRRLDIFLKYVKLARVFLNNVEVEQ